MTLQQPLRRYPYDLVLHAEDWWIESSEGGAVIIQILDDEPAYPSLASLVAPNPSPRPSKKRRRGKQPTNPRKDEECCPVCYSKYGAVKSSKAKMALSGCSHVVCEGCFDHIYRSRAIKNNCPLCRAPFYSDEFVSYLSDDEMSDDE